MRDFGEMGLFFDPDNFEEGEVEDYPEAVAATAILRDSLDYHFELYFKDVTVFPRLIGGRHKETGLVVGILAQFVDA